MAFRARLVGGRPSPFCSAEPGGGEILARTEPVDDLEVLGLGAVEELGVELSSAML